MNLKYLLLVYTKKNNTESYYSDNVKELYEYAKFRKFDNYKIFKLEEVTKYE